MSEKKYVYVVLIATESIVGHIVHLMMRDRYTHSALSLDDSLSAMCSFGRVYSYYPFYARFRHENVNEGFLSRCNKLPTKVIALPVTDEQYASVQERIAHFSDNRKRYRYNYRGFFFNLIGKSYCPKNRYTCSQFVSETLSECGIVEFDRPFSLIRPETLSDLDGEVIFEGDLREYSPAGA